jgi:uncharacterized protein YecA (UPF0149 family)
MHQSYDNKGSLVYRELVSAVNEEKLRSKLETLHQRDISNPHISKVIQEKIGRNDRCPCGSGVKFKKCCLPRLRDES